MQVAKIILATAVVIAVTCSEASAQQNLTGVVVQVYRANGQITIRQTQGATIDASGRIAKGDFEVQDGLNFGNVEAGDRLLFTVEEIGGVDTITKFEKQ
jgi:Copper binding periplasmic protein CusF